MPGGKKKAALEAAIAAAFVDVPQKSGKRKVKTTTNKNEVNRRLTPGQEAAIKQLTLQKWSFPDDEVFRYPGKGDWPATKNDDGTVSGHVFVWVKQHTYSTKFYVLDPQGFHLYQKSKFVELVTSLNATSSGKDSKKQNRGSGGNDDDTDEDDEDDEDDESYEEIEVESESGSEEEEEEEEESVSELLEVDDDENSIGGSSSSSGSDERLSGIGTNLETRLAALQKEKGELEATLKTENEILVQAKAKKNEVFGNAKKANDLDDDDLAEEFEEACRQFNAQKKKVAETKQLVDEKSKAVERLEKEMEQKVASKKNVAGEKRAHSEVVNPPATSAQMIHLTSVVGTDIETRNTREAHLEQLFLKFVKSIGVRFDMIENRQNFLVDRQNYSIDRQDLLFDMVEQIAQNSGMEFNKRARNATSRETAPESYGRGMASTQVAASVSTGEPGGMGMANTFDLGNNGEQPNFGDQNTSLIPTVHHAAVPSLGSGGTLTVPGNADWHFHHNPLPVDKTQQPGSSSTGYENVQGQNSSLETTLESDDRKRAAAEEPQNE